MGEVVFVGAKRPQLVAGRDGTGRAGSTPPPRRRPDAEELRPLSLIYTGENKIWSESISYATVLFPETKINNSELYQNATRK